MAVIDKHLVRLAVDAADAEMVIRMLASDMVERGLVDAGYCTAVLEREQIYPTGLPMGEIEVAIPHASGGHVLRSGIAIAQLTKAVDFRSMGDHEQMIKAQLVFLLAIADPKEQLQTLRMLIATLQDMEAIDKLTKAQTKEQFVAVLCSMGWEEKI